MYTLGTSLYAHTLGRRVYAISIVKDRINNVHSEQMDSGTIFTS